MPDVRKIIKQCCTFNTEKESEYPNGQKRSQIVTRSGDKTVTTAAAVQCNLRVRAKGTASPVTLRQHPTSPASNTTEHTP